MDIFAPIQSLADVVTFQWLRITPDTYSANAVNFFIYDVIKIGFLLIVINYIMAITRYYFPMEKIKDILTKRRWYGLDYLLAALLGVITPFCSCSSIPLFIGFLSAGIPLGITFAFLISSPLVNEASLYLFPTVFGLKATILYNLIGMGVSILGGMLIQRLNMEKYIQPEFLKLKSKKQIEIEYNNQKVPFNNLIKHWTSEAMDITKKVFPYVVLGVAIGALIHGFIPENLITKYLAIKSWYVIPLATLMGVPLYANSVSVIPVIEALVGKGIPMGTALAFMTSTVTLSFPEALILKKLMKWPLLATFFGITILGIMFIGYLFNFLF
ncbi:permease [Candidatus Beckwithbacteria bacterium CG10_big_fil_rev_8_21_14_0_10_34_10]|uniref:Permease n=1 Tax=Candidatus Beckwithbacteria bacterium CG10_big_fil_rev_8_21_14_0_10_34_10 TaxID=1974495 RepID=A0A2H0W9X1_9BACT|nr:MAG: permease [Candidatus Beckwithbacteria bacterium CG10_big_fil_rev_8_21_14_0_10_34_10]